MSQNRLKNLRRILLSVLGILILVVAFSLSKSIANGNPPPRKEAGKVVKDVYYVEVKNNVYNVQIPSNGVLEAYQRIKVTARVQGLMQTISPLFNARSEKTSAYSLGLKVG